MLTSKKEWSEKFIGSSRYKDVIEAIDNLPYPEYFPTFQPFVVAVHPDLQGPRMNFYMKKVLPLNSFYYIDYIHNQTNGEEIVNVCDTVNFFAGMYNITLWNGARTYYNSTPLPLFKAIVAHKNRYDNVMSVCEPSCTPLHHLSEMLAGLADTIKKDKVGYGYVAFNSHNAINITSDFVKNELELQKYYKLNEFVDNAVYDGLRRCDIIAYENLIDPETTYDTVDRIDGDVRILFRTKPSTEA